VTAQHPFINPHLVIISCLKYFCGFSVFIIPMSSTLTFVSEWLNSQLVAEKWKRPFDMCLTGSGKTSTVCSTDIRTFQLACPAALSFREPAVYSNTNMGDAGL